MKRKIFSLLLCIAFITLCIQPLCVSAAPSINAKYAVLVDADTDTVLYRKNMNDRIRPASLTKMMTLLVAYEQNRERLDEFITVTAEMIDVPAGSSSANLCDGDMISIHDLFYAMMLPSGNDAAKVLAYVTSGSETAFAELMNAKAAELGMNNTHYENAHGFDSDGHYTTAYDLSLLACKLCTITELVNVFSSYRYTAAIYPGGDTGSKKEIDYYNTNIMLNPNSQAYLDGLKGIKTGYTVLAGNCLASYYEKDSRHLVSIVAFSDQGSRDNDTRALFRYGCEAFDTFNKDSVFSSKRVIVDVENADANDESNGQLELYLEPTTSSGYMTVTKDVGSKIRTFQNSVISVRYPTVTAPVTAGDYVGDVEFVYNSEVVYTARALASRTVDANTQSPPDLISLGIKGKVRITLGFLSNKVFLITFFTVLALVLLTWGIIVLKKRHAKRVRSRQRNVTRKKQSSSRPGNRTML